MFCCFKTQKTPPQRCSLHSSDGELLFYVIDKPEIPEGYYIDSRSTSAVRIYSKIGSPSCMFYTKRSFRSACEAARHEINITELTINAISKKTMKN